MLFRSIYDDQGMALTIDVNPTVVEATIPVLPTKYVTVKPTFIGEPAEGYKLVDIKSEPTLIKIAAEQEVLDRMTEVETEPLDIEGAYYKVNNDKKIKNDGSFYIVDNEITANVTANIEKIIQKDFIYKLEDINIQNIPENLIVIPEEETSLILVTVKGITSVINQLSKEDLILTVDLTGATEGLNERKIVIDTQVELELISLDNETILITLENKTMNPESEIDTE